jgi:DNA helicase II / ATP-dependent DNA helicase PcrA
MKRKKIVDTLANVNSDDLDRLNPKQREAASIITGAVLVIAGAGSGKTRVVTTRIVQLIKRGVPAKDILAVTFTNKAAQEMKERVSKLTDSQVVICTFHSLGVKVLRQSIHMMGYQRDFIIYDADDSEKLLKACVLELGLKEKKIEISAFKSFISNAKNAIETPEDVEGDLDFINTYRLYQAKLLQYNAVDFDDLLYLTVKLWQAHPDFLSYYQDKWPFVLIDEYQDTNHAQYLIAKLLVQKSGNLFVVGDPDQSIYSWRGAKVKNILEFERDYPGAQVISLEQNYRSHTNILNAANDLITYNSNRYEKSLWSDLGEGEKIKLFVGGDEREEASFVTSQIRYHQQQGVPLNDIVVFYRTNAQSRAFEDLLLYRNIPYVIIGGISFYQRREIKDIMAFLRIAQCPSDYISFLRTINLPKRGFGDATIEKIRLCSESENLSIFAYCQALIQGVSLQHSIRLSEKQRAGLTDYIGIVAELMHLSKEGRVDEVVVSAIERSRYMEYLKEDPETFADRKENLDALAAKAVEWVTLSENPSLEAFLEELSLKSNLDETNSPDARLSLMTIHNSKGLEYKVAFLVGLEEGLFPHINSNGNEAGLEEERRLCYVGLTRAREYLYLSCCQMRYLWGSLRSQRPSRFLNEIPAKYMERMRKPYQYGSDAYNARANVVSAEFEAEFQVDDRVFHKDFGIGVVQEVGEGSLGAIYKVFFTKDGSCKNLIGKYAALKKLV